VQVQHGAQPCSQTLQGLQSEFSVNTINSLESLLQ